MSPLLSNLVLVAKQVAILFALMGVGYCCNKAKLFGETAVKGMTELLVMERLNISLRSPHPLHFISFLNQIKVFMMR